MKTLMSGFVVIRNALARLSLEKMRLTMGKRSDFHRRPRDAYPTPYAAIGSLLGFLKPAARYVEPCAGEGDLIRHLEKHGHFCSERYDISTGSDARTAQYGGEFGPSMIITNPPWDRKQLHPIIENCRKQAPTWLLIDSDWKHTLQAIPYMAYCHRIVSIGRVKWIPDSPFTGKDNCAWYLFDMAPAETAFMARTPRETLARVAATSQGASDGR
jgi:hypothetical protein